MEPFHRRPRSVVSQTRTADQGGSWARIGAGGAKVNRKSGDRAAGGRFCCAMEHRPSPKHFAPVVCLGVAVKRTEPCLHMWRFNPSWSTSARIWSPEHTPGAERLDRALFSVCFSQLANYELRCA